MGYTDDGGLKAAIAELKELFDAGKITDSQINDWINKGDSIIDSYCASKYAVPFTTVPPLIVTLSKELATFFFFRDQDRAEELRKNIWARVRDILKAIKEGSQKLILEDGTPVQMLSTQVDAPWSNRRLVSSIFDMEDFEGQSYDPKTYKN